MNVYAFLEDYILYYCTLKSYTADYIFPTELIHLIMIYYIDTFRGQLLESGDYHTLFYKDDMLYSFGSNSYKQISSDPITKTDDFVKYLPQLTNIACGSLYSIFVSKQIYGIGNNYQGQIGQIVNLNIDKPQSIKVKGKILSVACGAYHTVILTDQHLYGLGSNEYGQLSGYENNYYVPTIISTEAKIIKVRCGAFSTFLFSENDVYCMGANKYGQLGLNHFEDVHKMEKLDKNIVDISAGLSHTMFLCKNGDLYGAGSNHYGQLGEKMSNVLMVKCGEYFTIVLTLDGLYGFGLNHYGQLGQDHFDPCYKPTKIPIKKVLSFSCGKNFTIVNTRNGLYGFGANGKYQLGQCKRLI